MEVIIGILQEIIVLLCCFFLNTVKDFLYESVWVFFISLLLLVLWSTLCQITINIRMVDFIRHTSPNKGTKFFLFLFFKDKMYKYKDVIDGLVKMCLKPLSVQLSDWNAV